jgi:hypothetical protein
MSWYYGKLPDWMSAYDCPDKYTIEICVTHEGARRFIEISRSVERNEMINFALGVKHELMKAAQVAAKLLE